MGRHYAALGILFSSLLLASGDAALSVRLKADAHPSHGSGPSLFFAGEEAIVTVTVGYFDVSEEGTAASSHHLGANWWKSLRWELETADGTQIPIVSVQLFGEAEAPTALARNSSVDVRFSLGALPPGNYRVTTELPAVSNQAVALFRVRKGDEDPKVRAAALRVSLATSPSPAATRKILLELAALEPGNPEHYETLGVLLAQHAPLTQAVAYFRSAQSIAATNLAAYQKENPSVDCAAFERRIAHLAALAGELERLGAMGKAIELRTDSVRGTRRYTIVDRATKKVLWSR
ncbi:MAG: hypothetical protein LC732_10805 [Acidobacteria bacterium]|nr:hypothetical protein [Acidobacteriota bacterium]